MTTYWTRARWVSLGVHAGIVTIPFTISAVSAFLFWQRLFNSALLAGVMVSVVDILALLGLILFIAGITSPFQALRHLLLFVSILPLGLELYTLLAHNGMAVSVVVSVVVTAILGSAFARSKRYLSIPSRRHASKPTHSYAGYSWHKRS